MCHKNKPNQTKLNQTIPKGMSLKLDVIARLEFELASYDVTVHYVSHYTTATPLIQFRHQPPEHVAFSSGLYGTSNNLLET